MLEFDFYSEEQEQYLRDGVAAARKTDKSLGSVYEELAAGLRLIGRPSQTVEATASKCRKLGLTGRGGPKTKNKARPVKANKRWDLESAQRCYFLHEVKGYSRERLAVVLERTPKSVESFLAKLVYGCHARFVLDGDQVLHRDGRNVSKEIPKSNGAPEQANGKRANGSLKIKTLMAVYTDDTVKVITRDEALGVLFG